MVAEDRPEIIDLHTHSTFSDGLLSPYALIDRAASHGVTTLSITDHDSVAAYQDDALNDYGLSKGIDIVPGIEISTLDEDNDSFHVLGLYIDPYNRNLMDWTLRLQASRVQHALDVADALRSLGWQIDSKRLFEEPLITKAHIADYVLAEEANSDKMTARFGRKPSRGEFIETVMNSGGEAYVPRRLKSLSPVEAIEVVHGAGGVAFLAHPVASINEGMNLTDLEQKIVAYNFDGIEAIYYYFAKSRGDVEIDETERFIELARRHNLLISGGSDFHGESPSIGHFMDVGFPGKDVVPTKADLEKLKNRASTIKAA